MSPTNFQTAFATPLILPTRLSSSSTRNVRQSISVPTTFTPRRIRAAKTSLNQSHYDLTNQLCIQPPTCNLHDSNSYNQTKFDTSKLLATAAASLTVLGTLFVPHPSHARGRNQNTITMTDQVPNFTLPSQENAVNNEGGGNPLLIKVFGVAKTVIPVGAAIALIAWGSKVLFRRFQDKKIKDFQSQLQSFSTIRDVDATSIDSKAETSASSSAASKVFETTSKYKFTSDQKKGYEDEDISQKIRLDLFKAGGSSTSTSSENVTTTEPSKPEETVIPEIVPDTDFDRVIADCIAKAEKADESSKTEAVANFSKARKDSGLNEGEAQAAFELYASKVVSQQIDRAALNLNADDREILQHLNQLAVTVSATKTLSPDAQLKYSGSLSTDENGRELLYRRYAVFCLSSDERGSDEFQHLDEMQKLLLVSDKRAETINTEIAKGMFQIAVSAAMTDGGVSDESREALDKMKDAFGDYLDGGSADSIMSEVAVMRAMYSLQQLLQEQGVSDEDVQELRKMCADLGVDIDEMLENADALGEALGPEAKEFVESLKGILKKSSDDASTTMVTTTAKPVDSTQPLPGSSEPSQ